MGRGWVAALVGRGGVAARVGRGADGSRRGRVAGPAGRGRVAGQVNREAGVSRVGRGAGGSRVPRQPTRPLTLIRNCGVLRIRWISKSLGGSKPGGFTFLLRFFCSFCRTSIELDLLRCALRKLGVMRHPDLKLTDLADKRERRKSFLKAAVRVLYRCDLLTPAQDFQAAKKTS